MELLHYNFSFEYECIQREEKLIVTSDIGINPRGIEITLSCSARKLTATPKEQQFV
jgi:hypothetical protein